MQRAWKKHGERRFTVEVLEHCNVQKLVKREQHWIKVLDARNRSNGYNICNPGPAFRLGVPNSPSARRKMSERFKGIIPWQATNAAAKVNKGKKRPDLISVASRTHKGRKRSKTTRERIKANHWRNRPDWQEIIERSAEGHRGKKHTEEHKAKIGASHWSLGPNANEVRQRLVESLRAVPRPEGPGKRERKVVSFNHAYGYWQRSIAPFMAMPT